MNVTELRIENLRNLADVTLEPHPRFNFLVGANGAGKTSVLEALIVLSRGRSFRTTQAADLVGPEGPFFRVFAETQNLANETSRIGLERTGKHWRARKDGEDLKQLSDLARCLPLVLLEPNSHQLVSGTPDYRRKYLDWGVFHVEHGFLEVWSRYSKALRQRNAALRNRQLDVIESIDAILVPLADKMTAFRLNYTKRVIKRLESLMKELGAGIAPVTLTFSPGWTDDTYLEALERSRERDLERGVTHRGPHRAELNMTAGEHQARAVLSRGEQKTLSAALLLAQAELIAEVGNTPLLMLDDLASEFDEDRFGMVINRALSGEGQVWVSGTYIPELPMEADVFHVERGTVTKMV